jgi:hypothetical protein
VGLTVGDLVGDTVGDTVGDLVGLTVGDLVGALVGAVGLTVGAAVGGGGGLGGGTLSGQNWCAQTYEYVSVQSPSAHSPVLVIMAQSPRPNGSVVFQKADERSSVRPSFHIHAPSVAESVRPSQTLTPVDATTPWT